VEPKPRIIEHYVTAEEKCPFEEWMSGLEGQKMHGIILNRLERVKQGLFGDWDSIGEGAYELRIHSGPGYRIYYGLDGDKVILLCAGRKNKQRKNIPTAIEYWGDYNA
jgi:putative addiction module killer protein